MVQAPRNCTACGKCTFCITFSSVLHTGRSTLSPLYQSEQQCRQAHQITQAPEMLKYISNSSHGSERGNWKYMHMFCSL